MATPNRIALFGGSFNPPHDGHFEMAKYIYEALDVDEVWLLFSRNWQKDAEAYADIEHRMAMGRIMARNYPDIPVVMSDIQEELGTHMTYEVLQALRHRYPDNRFIWVMGADNLATFHTWENADDIIKNFPVAVVDRPPYTEAALSGPTAMRFHFLRAAIPQNLKDRTNGWCFLDNPKIDVSSSDLLARLRAGQTQFNESFQDVANYIIRNRLYAVNTSPEQHNDL